MHRSIRLAAQSYDENVLQASVQVRASRPAALCRAAGLSLFAAAFFVPAGEFVDLHHWPGYFSAWFTLLSAYAFVVRPDYSHHSQQLLLGMSGLVSPLAVISVSLSWWRRGKSLRIVIAAVTCLLLIVANVTIIWSGHLLQERVIPLLGHYFWTAGILVLLVSEFLKLKSISS